MQTIIKAKETMSAKERVLKTFNHEKTDRVAINYLANPGIHARLCNELGIAENDYDKLYDALGVDVRSANPTYTGGCVFPEKKDRIVNPLEGCYMRYVEHETGGYWDFCDFPLQGASDEELANYPVPSPDDFDYDGLAAVLEHNKDFANYVGDGGIADIINSNGRIMGMEDILCHLITENEAALYFINRRVDFQLGMLERVLDRYSDKIDFFCMGEDLGTQHTPMISLDLYRRVLRPIHQKFVDLAKAYNLPVSIHSCGSSSWAYEDFIEMGIDCVETLQPEAKDMSPRYLKQTFGNRLSYMGCISTAGPLAYGTEQETIDVCKDTLKIMMDGYGYIFAPTHAIQDNSPVMNVIAMYQAAHNFGSYK